MADAVPSTGLGIVCAIESATPGTYTTLADVYEYTPSEASMGVIDTTTFADTDGVRRQELGSLIEHGPCSITFIYDGESTTFTTLHTQFYTRTAKNYKFTEPGSSHEVVNAFITSISREMPLDDKMTCTVEFTPTSKPARTVV